MWLQDIENTTAMWKEKKNSLSEHIGVSTIRKVWKAKVLKKVRSWRQAAQWKEEKSNFLAEHQVITTEMKAKFDQDLENLKEDLEAVLEDRHHSFRALERARSEWHKEKNNTCFSAPRRELRL